MRSIKQKLLLLVCALLAATSFNAQQNPPSQLAYPTHEWSKFPTYRQSISNSAASVDSDNNAYVTGEGYVSSSYDLIVTRHDSLGNLIYMVNYDGGLQDGGRDIVVDKYKNVYVCGYTETSTRNDFLVVAYDSTGNFLWSYIFDRAGDNDEAVAIALNHAEDHIYVTGTSINSSFNTDITTICLQTDGTYVWDESIDGSAATHDRASDITISSDDQTVYVVGTTHENSTLDDIAVIAHDATNGGNLWLSLIDGNQSQDDIGKAVIISGANVVVAGAAFTTNDLDYAVIKLDGSSGTILWDVYYDYQGMPDIATGLVKDSVGNIAIIGTAMAGSGIIEYHTVLYDSTGAGIWLNTESSNSYALYAEPRIAMDTIVNSFYICGEKQNASKDVFIYHVDNWGNTQWKKCIEGNAANGEDAAVGIAVSGWGDIYVAANTQNPVNDFDITTIKISQTPYYFPLDSNGLVEPGSPAHYFYRNTGEIIKPDSSFTDDKTVVYYTKFTKPQEFILSDNRIAFVVAKHDTTGAGNDSLHRVDLKFRYSNPASQAYDFHRHDSDGVLNYFLGYLPSEITNVKGSERIMFPNIYPGVDAHLYSNDKGLKLYFVIKPGYDPGKVSLEFNGASSTTITGSSQLKINTIAGYFQFENPQAYWVDPTLTTHSVSAGWNNISGDVYSINTGTYNAMWPLVIQINQGAATTATLVNCDWSTYFGGINHEKIVQSKSDANKNLHVSGMAIANGFPQNPAASPFNSYHVGSYDAFLSRFNAVGELKWTAFVGGEGSDEIKDFDFSGGNTFCIGSSNSFSLPVQSKSGAFNDNSFAGFSSDGFIFQLSTNGANNLWCTYFGGSGDEELNACKFDGSGNFFVVGASTSTNCTVTGGGGTYQQNYNTAQLSQPGAPFVTDGIIMKFAASNSALSWSTYFGTHSVSIASNSMDNFYDLDIISNTVVVCGESSGINMPSSVNSKLNTITNEGIIVSFNTNGALNGSRYTTNITNNSVKINNSKIYTCGRANTALSTVNSGNLYFSSGMNGVGDANFSVHSLNLNTIHHSTFLGGSQTEEAFDLQFAPNGVFYIAGITKGSFPFVSLSNAYGEWWSGNDEYFITAHKEGISNMIWSTCFGSPQYEGDSFTSCSINIDGNNNLFLCGATASPTSYPLANGGGPPVYFQSQKGLVNSFGDVDGAVSRFSLSPVDVYVGINEIVPTKNSDLLVYPNPSNQFLSLKTSKENGDKLNYTIVNIIGQEVLKGTTLPHTAIDITSLSSGAYLIIVTDSNYRYTSKFIKTE